MSSKRLYHIAVSFIMLCVTAVMLFPLLIVINISLKSKEEFIKYPLSLVSEVHFDNFLSAWKQGSMGIYFKNSVIITIITVIGVVIITCFAAYPIARGHLRFSGFLYKMFLSGLYLPVSLIPLIYLMNYMGFINFYPGYIIYVISGQIPVSVFMFCGFIKSIPTELDKAATVDGCPYIKYILTIIFPL